MDMSQFKQLFSTTRIPGPDGDYLVTRSESDYIVVTHRNRWYAITIYNDKTIYNETEKVRNFYGNIKEHVYYRKYWSMQKNSRSHSTL